MFIVLSLLWGWAVDGMRPDRFDAIGAVLCLVGMAVIMYAPRGWPPVAWEAEVLSLTEESLDVLACGAEQFEQLIGPSSAEAMHRPIPEGYAQEEEL